MGPITLRSFTADTVATVLNFAEKQNYHNGNVLHGDASNNQEDPMTKTLSF